VLARKSLLLFTVNMAGSALGFLSTIVIARWMGAAALGSVGYLLGLLGLLSVLLDMGTGLAHLKRVSETDQDPASLIGAFLLIRVALVVVFLLAVILLPVIRYCLGQPLFRTRDEWLAYCVIAAFYILNSLATVFLYTFEARLETAKESIPDFGGNLVSFVAKATVAFGGLGVTALSAAYLIEPMVRLGLALPLFRGYHITRGSRQQLTSYVRYALPLTLSTALSMVVANINPVVIRAFWAAAEVGYYSSVLGFGIVMDRVASTVMVLFFPQASNDVARGNWEEIRRRLFVIERYVLTVVVPFAVALVFFSKEVVAVALGAEFAPAASILVCLAINSIVGALFQPYRIVLYAIEKQGYLVVSGLVGLVALLLADALLVPRQVAGLAGTGAALGLIAMTVTSGLVQVRAVSRHTGIGLYWRAVAHLLAGLVMYLSMQVVSALVAAFWPRLTSVASWWIWLPFLSLFGLVLYLAVLALMGQFTRADLRVFLNVLHPVRMAEYVSGELDRRG
jgi:O-antigen/teichoic acid export membrane protein